MKKTSDQAEQKKLLEFLSRRHPAYARLLPHWKFLELCYEGGREWFSPDNLFKYIKEGENEYKDRAQRAYRFNHTREVVDLVDKYLFKMQSHRNEKDAPESVKKFWKATTMNGMGIRDFMRQVSQRSSVFGRSWIIVDNTASDAVISKADEADVSTYAYIVKPESVLDFSYDDGGRLNWILIHEQVRDDVDPIESSGVVEDQYRLWERNQWTLFTIDRDRNGRVKVIKDGPHPHNLGEVPAIPADCSISVSEDGAPALIADVAYLDRAIANYLSNLDAIIQDQTFSQLAMPAQNLLPGSDAYSAMVEMGTKRVFLFDGEGGKEPKFISPDVKQAEIILKVINKIINEIYQTVGLSGERTKEDNALGIDNSSGVAKAYDFERVNSLLAAKADSLELIERRMAVMVAKWNGDDVKDIAELVSYPDNFDVRGLYDEFQIAARLSLVEAPDAVRQEQMEMLIDKLFPNLAKDLREKMRNQVQSGWPPKLEVDAAGKPIKKESDSSLSSQLVKD